VALQLHVSPNGQKRWHMYEPNDRDAGLHIATMARPRRDLEQKAGFDRDCAIAAVGFERECSAARE